VSGGEEKRIWEYLLAEFKMIMVVDWLVRVYHLMFHWAHWTGINISVDGVAMARS